ncbi:MAG TPA: transferrin receptor-like dimerization domain-containing protein, partial [Anaerolineales bacterium]|nr:transferrin receptor-like dimerization domain-containing protein [Anaerolineales bacterium]
MRDLFKSWGYDAKLETYKVLFPTPKIRIVELVAPGKFKAKLAEPAVKEDATSNQLKEQLPTYNAWSADGDVTGELVFVNYGVPDDYDQLERMGIDVKGKIVIAKYGGSWRGIKPKVAQEHGAIGCLIYSDPEGDGYFQGDVYPKGPYRNEHGAQRGAVMDLPVRPGDPITPGEGATENAKRIDRKDADNLLKIPVHPISYADAEPLLRALGGPVAPERWRGALPFTYHVGPGPAKVHIKLEFDWKLVDCHNVIAVMKGSELPDEWVVRGNHHDAWVNGANDPISGMVALMEEARAVGELTKTGWKPKRTLVYCGWDGEEPALIGSTEWVEHHADELRQKVVAYINSDASGRGFLYAGGSHTLEPLMDEISREVIDPQTGVTVFQRLRAYEAVNASNPKDKKAALEKPGLKLEALGSGSDYSPFFQHLGIPSLNLGYGGEDGGGEYHSIYDSYDHYVRFKDPKFVYGIVLVKTAGRATLRLANADVLPFDFQAFHSTVTGYLNEVMLLLENMREATEVENRLINNKDYTHAADPTIKFVVPAAKEAVPYLDFSALQNAMSHLQTSSGRFLELSRANPKPNTNLNTLNKVLYQAEQKLMVQGGLPRRPWYRHSIYSPGYYTGYGVKTLPGIREAIEQRNWKEAQQQIEVVAKAITDYTREVEAATKILM